MKFIALSLKTLSKYIKNYQQQGSYTSLIIDSLRNLISSTESEIYL